MSGGPYSDPVAHTVTGIPRKREDRLQRKAGKVSGEQRRPPPKMGSQGRWSGLAKDKLSHPSWTFLPHLQPLSPDLPWVLPHSA